MVLFTYTITFHGWNARDAEIFCNVPSVSLMTMGQTLRTGSDQQHNFANHEVTAKRGISSTARAHVRSQR